MYPIICSIGPFTVYSYGLMLAAAFLTGASLIASRAKRTGLPSEAMYNLCFIGVIAGIFGARLLYVIEHFSLYRRDLLEMVMLQHGGLSWIGGFAGGSAAAWWYLAKKKIPLYPALDCIAPYLALSQAIGRIGCLLNGCCYGIHGAGCLYFPSLGDCVLPTQIYSSLLLIVIFLILRARQERHHPPGEVFFLYLFLYSIKRFGLEFLRGDTRVILWGLKLFQYTSSALFIVSAVMLLRLKKR